MNWRVVLAVVLVGVFGVPMAWAEPADSAGCLDQGIGGIEVIESPTLRVATLNIAHGRKDSVNQMLLSGATIRENLLELAGLLDRAEADAIALQEVDAASAWSGDFNHLEYLLEHSGYRCWVHGVHANNRLYHFGTALISPHVFNDSLVHGFRPSRPTTTKGFVIGVLAWNPGGALTEPLAVRVGSLHLDFSRRSVRQAQIEEVVEVLGGAGGPLVLMGDFNTDWHKKDSSLRELAGRLDLKVFQPDADGMTTYGKDSARLDWILVSEELDFLRHAVYPDVVSDHLAVVADIQLSGAAR
jgi:endonuclease/exonuclease/phosphatase family metal-dependent hydrolase